jgi:hypothetical protein
MRLLIVAGMLVLAVSASLTPANAAGGAAVWCADPTLFAHRSGMSVPLAVEICCQIQCPGDANIAYAQERGWGLRREADKKVQACLSKCVNAFEASFHRGGVRPNQK